MPTERIVELADRAVRAVGEKRAARLAQFNELGAEIQAVSGHMHEGEIAEAHEAMRAALDLAYELLGDCDLLDELAEAIGYEEEK